MFRYRLLFCVLMAGLLANCADPQSTNDEKSVKLTGTVVQNTSGATVYLWQGRAVDSTTIDSADGYYEFASVPTGTYTVKIVAPGYDTVSGKVQLSSDYENYFLGNSYLIELSKDYADSIPSVYDYSPLSGSQIIYLPPDQYQMGSAPLSIAVSFDRPMDRQSVERALTVEPGFTGGYFEWFQYTKKFNYTASVQSGFDTSRIYGTSKLADYTSSVSIGAFFDVSAPVSATISTYSDVRSFVFHLPRSACMTDTVYKVTISTEAVDTAGTPLDTTLVFSFRTIQSAVSYNQIQMTPNNGDDFVDLQAPSGIRLVFPRRMDQQSVESHLSLSPDTSFFTIWTDYNHLTIYTGGFFVPDTTYSIRIDSSALDIEGNPLGETTTLNFSTRSIRVTGSNPDRGELGVSPSGNLELTFNTNMDQTTVASRLTLVSSRNDTIPGTARYYYTTYSPYTDTTTYLSRIVFDPATSLTKGEMYTLGLKPGATDLKGYPMRDGYQLQFVVRP